MFNLYYSINKHLRPQLLGLLGPVELVHEIEGEFEGCAGAPRCCNVAVANDCTIRDVSERRRSPAAAAAPATAPQQQQ